MNQIQTLRAYIAEQHQGNVTHAAKALGKDRSTLHRIMDSGYVIGGALYTRNGKENRDD